MIYFTLKNGQIRDIPTCRKCGRLIVRAGICEPCSRLPNLEPSKVIRVSVPLAIVVNPKDLTE